ncbi:CvpA family protein [Planctomycetota bacterium]
MDVFLGAILILHVAIGLRRGILKEMIGILALVVATWLAVSYYARLGPNMAELASTSPESGFALAAAALWFGGYLLVHVCGRLLVWRLKRAPEDGEGVVDAARGALATLVSLADKLLGAVVGFLKGALLILVVLLVVDVVDLGRLGAAVRGSYTMELNRTHVMPTLSQVPEVRVARSVGDAARVADFVRAHPDCADRLAGHSQLGPLFDYEPVRALRGDAELKRAAQEKRYSDVLRHPKVVAVLKDREVIRRLADVDFERILRDLEADR